MMADTMAFIPDAAFKSCALIGVLFSMIYRKKMKKWPWE